MYICGDCGMTFERPIIGIEEEPNACPNCGSWFYREAKKCKVCGEYAIDDICEGCKAEFKTAVNGFIDLYVKELGMSRDDVIDLIEDSLEYGGDTFRTTAERIGAI